MLDGRKVHIAYDGCHLAAKARHALFHHWSTLGMITGSGTCAKTELYEAGRKLAELVCESPRDCNICLGLFPRLAIVLRVFFRSDHLLKDSRSTARFMIMIMMMVLYWWCWLGFSQLDAVVTDQRKVLARFLYFWDKANVGHMYRHFAQTSCTQGLLMPLFWCLDLFVQTDEWKNYDSLSLLLLGACVVVFMLMQTYSLLCS